MDIRQLKYFKTIVEEESISKAALVLHMAQPPLSKQLKQMEEEIGVTLINRGKKNWELTEAGHLLYQHANDILYRMDDMKQEFTELKKGMRGTLSIGVSYSCLFYFAEGIKYFKESHPNVYIKVFEGDSYYLQELLLQRKIELAFMLLPLNMHNFNTLQLPKESFVVIIPKKWKIHFPNNTINLSDIAHYPFLTLAPMKEHHVYENIVNQFQKKNLSVNIVLEARDISTLITLVSSEIGISIIPKKNVHARNNKNIEILNLKDPFLYIEPAVIWVKNQYHTVIAKQFLDDFEQSRKSNIDI